MIVLRRLARATATVGLLLSGLIAASAQASAAELSDAERQEVRDLVRETILENPEILTEAIAILRSRQAEAEMAAAQQAITDNADALFRDPDDPVLGNPAGDVTVVEFFDYRCGYCKRVFGPVMDTVDSDGNVRLVMKEFPILGPQSVLAARWSMAASMQDKYAPFHTAVMAHRGDITEDVLRTYAKEAGLDVERAAKDADSAAVEDVLRDNMKLAASMGISGTPAFIVGDQLMPGAVDAATLKQAIDAARKDG